jgi:hypothetical protein
MLVTWVSSDNGCSPALRHVGVRRDALLPAYGMHDMRQRPDTQELVIVTASNEATAGSTGGALIHPSQTSRLSRVQAAFSRCPMAWSDLMCEQADITSTCVTTIIWMHDLPDVWSSITGGG